MNRSVLVAQDQSGRRALIVYGALFNAVRQLDVSTHDLEQIIGLSSATISRLRKSLAGGADHEVNTKSYECILLFLRMFRSLDSIFGGNLQHCKEWLNSNNHALGGRPIESLKATEGLVRVVSYLDAMRAKV